MDDDDKRREGGGSWQKNEEDMESSHTVGREEESEVIIGRKRIAELRLIEDIHKQDRDGFCDAVTQKGGVSSDKDWPKRDDIQKWNKNEFWVLSNAGIENEEVRKEPEGLSSNGVKSVDTDDEEDSPSDASDNESLEKQRHMRQQFRQQIAQFRQQIAKLSANRVQNSRAPVSCQDMVTMERKPSEDRVTMERKFYQDRVKDIHLVCSKWKRWRCGAMY